MNVRNEPECPDVGSSGHAGVPTAVADERPGLSWGRAVSVAEALMVQPQGTVTTAGAVWNLVALHPITLLYIGVII